MPSKVKGFRERLADGETIILAEGYVFEFERRGYLQAGSFVPVVTLEKPEAVRLLYEEFVHAGSDIVQALTYYAHRAKLRIIGRENELEKMNRDALKMARQVADETGTLMAGNICNTSVWKPDSPEADEKVRNIFKEEIRWAVEEGADLLIGETYFSYGEAKIALDCMKEFGNGLPIVLNISANSSHDPTRPTPDGVPLIEALKRLQEEGADVVGLNCHNGPMTMIKYLREARKVIKGPMAAMPVPYRTSDKCQSMHELFDPETGKKSFPVDLDQWLCSRQHIVDFGNACKELGIQVVGICCGNRSHMTRTLAETLGRTPPASQYSMDMSKHISVIDDEEHGFSVQSFRESFHVQSPV